jgi:hypothetical protein
MFVALYFKGLVFVTGMSEELQIIEEYCLRGCIDQFNFADVSKKFITSILIAEE